MVDATRVLLNSWSIGEPVLTSSMSPWAPEGIGPCCVLPESSGTGHHLFVSGRDHNGEQRIAHVEIATSPAGRAWLHNIALEQGETGRFDANGVGYPFVSASGGERVLHYVGWLRLAGKAPFRNDIAVASLDPDWRVRHRPAVPLMPPTQAESYGTGSCCVFQVDGHLTMLYTSFGPWKTLGPGLQPTYVLRQLPIDQAPLSSRRPLMMSTPVMGEHAMAHPSVLMTTAGALCVFTARGRRYRLFGAVSADGTRWKRLPGHLVIPAGALDSDMQCYPRFFNDTDGPALFYSGDRYGRDTLLVSRWVGPPLEEVVAAILEK